LLHLDVNLINDDLRRDRVQCLKVAGPPKETIIKSPTPIQKPLA